ncbi:chondroitin sulfate proteoglycan 4-like isoform X2 [Numida meleagris]|uniref:chondroitin sulfate proteoglycan 4-like isoform X2 n=1 Tax=Numida meleagris TaxID=8996 RepID=UPI000B3E2C7C|nr:chondroitin sulfate proteoglycan 4-like isoform X2 [Numida meleagris]
MVSPRSARSGGGMAGGLRAPLLAVLALLLAAGRAALAVSFYGNSFVALKMAEASYQTTLQLQFLTNKPHGLLFLAAGKKDYCLIELQSGNLQLRINFGMGEQILRSRQRSHLNDLAWHLVELHHERDNVTLLIDKNDRTTTKMPGFLHELNIDHGFYLGGTIELDVPYLVGALPSFRGCIDNVLFNQLDILMPLRSSDFKKIHEVSVGCSDEFFAGEDEPISFFSSRSYISFPLWNVDGEGILEYALQTSAAHGLLLYHPGQEGDFVAMAMEDGLIKAYTGKHKSRTQLSSHRLVNDSHWHYIKLKFTAEYLQLTLDKETVKKSFPPQNGLPLLKGSLFVGGVDDSKRSEVIKLELTSMSGKYARGRSFRGCLRDLKVNSEKKSLKNVQVTKDISAGCETQNAFNTNLSLEMAVRYPTVKAAPTLAISPENSLGWEDKSHLLVLSNLIVQEGGQASLESKHIKVNLDFQKLGINQSQILFEIKEPPSHGNLKLDIEPVQEVNMFTLQDVWQGKILYIHGGSEDTYDYFNFSISANSRKIVPPYLQRNEEYMFSITITPVNDAPEITLAEGNLLLLIENSKKRLTGDLIKVLDNDTDPLDLSLSVLGNLNANAGYLENSKHPGKAITTFSNEDLRKGNVFFVHTGVRNSRIVLRANDGEKVSNTIVLRVMAIPLDYKVVSNPGIKLVQGATALITPRHLTVETNANLQELEIRASNEESMEWTNFDSEVGLSSVEVRFNISVQLKNDEKPVRVVDKVFNIVRNGQRLLTLADLCYHDPDSDFEDGQLLYTRRGISNGDLVLTNDSLHQLYQFKQADLEQKQVLFIHRGADFGRFVLFVTDGKHYTSFLLEVNATDPYVSLANNTGLLVQKGKEEVITTANLSAITNQDIRNDHEITFEITTFPKYGRISVNSLMIDSFTQLDLIRGYVIYRHDDSNNLIDTFNFTVCAKDVHLDAAMYVRMYLESHQWPPKIVNNSTLLVEEGKPVKISKGKLQVAHENSSPSEIVFTVRQLPVHGYIRKFSSEGSYLGADQKPVLTFTQQDVDEGKVQYVQTVSDQLSDRFSLDVTNGIQTVNGIEISVDIIPRVIPLKVKNFTVIEGGSKALVEDYLKISSRHFAGLSCEIILVDQPNHGYFEDLNAPGIKLNKFTKKQVEQELIYYVHDGSEELMDNFTFIVNNTELRKQSLPQTMFVTVTAVNDETPVIKINRILQVWEGSVTEITIDDLCAEDKDSSPSDLIYSITPPSNGYLALKSSPNKSILSFTQAHIIEGQLVFVHNGAMSGGFNFQVTDGLNFAPRQIFSITAQTLVISLEVNKGLRIFPGSRKPISQHDLKAVTSDVTNAGNRTITFMIVVSPKLGRLIRINSDNTTQEILSFTQSMVNEGVIMYEHSDAESADWSAEDFFTFTVSSPPSALDPQMFHIVISYEIPRHDRNSRLLANTGTIVQEGGRILINRTNLDASNLLIKLPEVQRSMYEVWYQVVSLPQHGIIIVGERNVTKEKPNFSQYILNKFGIVYVHDNSESLKDNFTFAVWLNLKTKSATRTHSEVLEEMFNITVVPVNDQPPELKTKRLHLKVLQGDVSVLGSENLKVEDLDNTPAELKYTIVSNPNNGYLAMKSNLSVSVQDFTQADVDSGRVWFVQDGSSSSGVFYFSVTDGKHRPLYKLFSLEVVPIALVLVNLTDVALPQGQTSVTVTNTQLSAVTNGKSTNIMYEITQPLKYGHLMIENEQVSKFEQADLNSGRLSYHLTNFTVFKEVLEFMIFTVESNLTEQVLNITMKPLVQVVSDMQISNQAVYKLKSDDLDASELANLTNSNPRFEVIVPPAHGRIVKKRFVNDAVFEDVQTFTQTDIDGGVVLLSVDTNMTGIDLLNDSFTFVLRADNVQPAVGHFEYSIVPCSPSLVQNFIAEVPFITSMTTLKIPATSNDRVPVSSHDKVPTVAPKKTVPGMWLGRKRWGNQLEERPSLNMAVGTRGSEGTETTDQVNAMRSREQAAESSNLWYIIIPLVLLSVLLIIAVISVCILLMCQKKERAKPLVRNQTDVVFSSPGHCLERSLTVPTVTVTPLLKRAEESTSSSLMAVRHEQLLPTVLPPTVEQPLQNSWLNLDPEMIQYCRKTNPTLKRSQYWV